MINLKVRQHYTAVEISGNHVEHFVQYCFSSESNHLKNGESQPSSLSILGKKIDGQLIKVEPSKYAFSFRQREFGLVATFLRELSDGYIAFDEDLPRRIPGPIVVIENPQLANESKAVSHSKYKTLLYRTAGFSRKTFARVCLEGKYRRTVKATPLYENHKAMGAKIIPFAGWEMPVWYTSVVEEHLACREAAGLFDVSHMGVLQAEGPQAAQFLDTRLW